MTIEILIRPEKRLAHSRIHEPQFPPSIPPLIESNWNFHPPPPRSLLLPSSPHIRPRGWKSIKINRWFGEVYSWLNPAPHREAGQKREEKLGPSMETRSSCVRVTSVRATERNRGFPQWVENNDGGTVAQRRSETHLADVSFIVPPKLKIWSGGSWLIAIRISIRVRVKRCCFLLLAREEEEALMEILTANNRVYIYIYKISLDEEERTWRGEIWCWEGMYGWRIWNSGAILKIKILAWCLLSAESKGFLIFTRVSAVLSGRCTRRKNWRNTQQRAGVAMKTPSICREMEKGGEEGEEREKECYV